MIPRSFGMPLSQWSGLETTERDAATASTPSSRTATMALHFRNLPF